MRLIINLLLLLLYFHQNESKAQTRIDSLYAVKVDSIINQRQKNDTNHFFKGVEDSINHRNIYGIFEQERLICIYYLIFSSEGSEQVRFYISDDSLIRVDYILSDVDNRSSRPPRTTHTFYFKHNKQVYHLISHFWIGAIRAGTLTIDNKNFVEEFLNYRLLFNDK